VEAVIALWGRCSQHSVQSGITGMHISHSTHILLEAGVTHGFSQTTNKT
jgi:hypothetical protein